MKRASLFVILMLPVLLGAPARAQEGHQPQHTHMHEPAEKLGQVNFKVSCNPLAQKQFNRAVAWL
ncbi:MAG TPA: hypothetical protein VK208_01130, partial [Pyrinomonadaceae bacterium]|nr:hypothetical protein [Pyrinomonadaceae bacterium]